MPIYIDADALKEKAHMIEIFDKQWVVDEIEIDMAPTADVMPVVRGEWEVAIGYDPNKKVQCQNCYKMAYEPTPYCPNCGVKMK